MNIFFKPGSAPPGAPWDSESDLFTRALGFRDCWRRLRTTVAKQLLAILVPSRLRLWELMILLATWYGLQLDQVRMVVDKDTTGFLQVIPVPHEQRT